MTRPYDDLIGKRLGQYEIIGEIGRGGMATVYRACQSSINRMIAIKVLPPQFLHDPSFLERFKREVEVIAHLEHPHILPIYDYGEANGLPFIAIRYLAGGTLSDRLVAGPVPLAWLEKPLAQIADALDYAHRRGVVHRDLKPANILLDEHNNAYLTDFGIARVLNSNLTGSAIIGTPAYMSPEQAHGADVDGRSDVYALGVVLFQMITGREPYEATTPVAVLLKHINEPMPLARSLRPDVPPAIDSVIQKATAKNPDDRYATATALAQAYSAALHGRPLDLIPDDRPVDRDAPTLLDVRPLRDGNADDAPDTAVPLVTSRAPATAAGPNARGWSLPLAPVVLLALAAGALTLALALDLPRRLTSPAPPPTPFEGARIFDGGLYRLSVPEGWTMDEEVTDEDIQRAVWEDGDDAGLRLTIRDAALDDTESFIDSAEAHTSDAYAGNDDFTLIDAATTPDGSLRRSYAVSGDATRAYGQTDVFYLNRAPYLVVVEMYTSADSGNRYVPTLQQMLDSLQVNGA